MPFLFPKLVIGFIAGLVVGSWFILPSGFLGVPLLLLVLLVFCYRRQKQHIQAILALLLFASLGLVHAQRILPRDFPKDHVIDRAGGDVVDLEGVIVRSPEIREDLTRITLEAIRLVDGRRSVPIRGLVLVTVGQGGERFCYGDQIRVRCRLRMPEPQGNPGAFSWKRFLAFKGVFVKGFVRDARAILLIRHGQGSWLRGQVEGVRRRLSTFIRQEFPSPARELLLALVVGERWAVGRSLREAFAAIGVAHVLAISGLHLGLIAMVAYGVARWFLLRLPWLVLHIPVEKVAWGLTFPWVVGYALIAGIGTSTQRALIMILSLGLAFMLDRMRNLYHALALAALIILLINPASVYNLSFQLSFLAVLGILYAVPRWREALRRRDPLAVLEPKRRLGKLLDGLVLLSLSTAAAILATLPVAMLHFHRVPAGALPANLLLVPLVGFVVLPLALTGSALFLLWPLGGQWLLWLSAWILQGVGHGVQFGAQWIGGSMYLPSPRPWEVFIFYTICAGLCHVHRLRWVRWMTLGLAAVLVGLWTGEGILQRLSADLRIHCLSVGNGLSVLVEGPNGSRMLVDGGGTYDDRVDIGALQVAPVLWHRRLANLDRVVLSHPHPDHMNGLRFILKAFRVDSLWDNGDRPPSKASRAFRDTALEQGLSPCKLHRGMLWKVGDAVFQVLHPPESLQKPLGKDQASRTNNGSVVMRISLGRVSFLLPGDIEAEAETWLVSRSDLRSTVLVAPHHGSRTSNSYLGPGTENHYSETDEISITYERRPPGRHAILRPKSG